MQPSLFAPCPDDAPRLLFADTEGGIRHVPAFVDPGTAARWFDDLRAAVPWRRFTRPMYDRVVEVPRLVASYRLDGDDLPASLHAARAQVAEQLDAPFDTVGLNLYRDGNDSVAPHNDTLHALAPRQPIALVSLGGVRQMVIAPKPGVPGRRIRIALEPGSLLVMSHASQSTHDHGVPKTRLPAEPRISLAFRVTRPGGDLLRGYRVAG